MSQDRGGWRQFAEAIRSAPRRADDWVQQLKAIPDRASDIAEEHYGNSSARDASAKNAFRHALGTGMVAHHAGGGIPGAVAAKLMGYAYEAPKLLNPKTPQVELEDTRHDLNANALGAWVSMQAKNQNDLVQSLRGYAARSSVEPAPAVVARHVGRLTRSVR